MKRRSESERQAVVARYRESGQSRRAFAASEGISEQTLSNWLSRLSGLESGAFVELPIRGRTEVELRFADGTILSVRG